MCSASLPEGAGGTSECCCDAPQRCVPPPPRFLGHRLRGLWLGNLVQWVVVLVVGGGDGAFYA
eukprot:10214463-Lingulodinium_polyedra.AAC.1